MAVLGQITVNEITILEVDANPSTGSGAEAPVGSIAIMTDGSGIYQKTGAADTAWTLVTFPSTISANQVSFSTLVAFFGSVNNVKDALDLLGLDKANLYNGNDFTGLQTFRHPSNTNALFGIFPGYYTGNNGLFLRTPFNTGPFVLGYLNNTSTIMPLLGRAVNNGDILTGLLADDTLVASQNRIVQRSAVNNRYAQLNGSGFGVGFLTNDQPASAALEVRSGSQGILIPRLTESEINAISSPASYLTVFNTTRNCLSHFIAGIWTFEQYVYVTNTASNNTINWTNVPITAINTLPPGRYEVRGFFTFNSAAAATGIGIRFAADSGSYSNMFLHWSISAGTNGSTTMFWDRTQLTAADNYVAPSSTATANNLAIVEGFFNTTTGVVPSLQIRSEVAGLAVTLTGGYFLIKRVG